MMRRRIGRDVKNQDNGIFLRNIYNGVSELIISDHPEFTEDTFISSSDLNYYRKKYIESLLKKEKEYARTEEDVLNSYYLKRLFLKTVIRCILKNSL